MRAKPECQFYKLDGWDQVFVVSKHNEKGKRKDGRFGEMFMFRSKRELFSKFKDKNLLSIGLKEFMQVGIRQMERIRRSNKDARRNMGTQFLEQLHLSTYEGGGDTHERPRNL